ncbi:MAG: hypothetical protein DRR19_11890 [Candidatus Parabeggiatoa sp. nov. 1]|nr:MAG: hypothetical protein DRR19_11890 [Gammaproteobacteria bacterium]
MAGVQDLSWQMRQNDNHFCALKSVKSVNLKLVGKKDLAHPTNINLNPKVKTIIRYSRFYIFHGR